MELPAIAMAASIGGTLIQTVGAMQQAAGQEAEGEAINQQKLFEARQMKVKAGQERASAQRAANEQRRKTNLATSNLKAASAANGGGADPSLINSLADILTEGQYRSDVETYQGEDAARGLESGADLSEYEGAAAKRAGKMTARATRVGAFGNLLSGTGTTLYNKYAPEK